MAPVVKATIFISATLTSVFADLNFFNPLESVSSIVENDLSLLGYHKTTPVMTSKGLVQGRLATTVGKGVKYSIFLGIPFAKPPLGTLRFKPPQDADPWDGVYKATRQKDKCPQKGLIFGGVIGNEDCLHLNVYTPKISLTDMKKRAVMVWIHGGGFTTGSSSRKVYGPDFLIEEDVVVVAMNYRLGVLGFLSLNHTGASGNAGLKDQKKALEWVQQNIENFGGDPKKVTIFGQSAGSASVMYQVISEASNGLFRSAIAMSGSTFNSWGFVTPSEAVSRSFAIGRALGVDTEDPSVLLEKLYSVSVQELVQAPGKVTDEQGPYLLPTIEGFKAESPFLRQCPADKLTNGTVNQVSLVMGFTNLETLLFAGLRKSGKAMVIGIGIDGTKNYPGLQSTEEVKFLQEAQTRSDNNEDFSDKDLYKLVNITSAIMYQNGIDLTQQFLVSEIPVYYYRNSFDYPMSLHRVLGIHKNGTGHADDVPQIFWSPFLFQSLDPESDIGIQRTKMVKMWTNFAKYGNPTPDGDSDPVLKINWPVSDSEGTYLEINKNYTVGKRPVDDFVKRLQQEMKPLLRETNGCQYNSN